MFKFSTSHNRVITKIISLFLLLVFTTPAYSGVITEQTPLNFGTIALKNNAAQYTLRLRYTGQIINDPEIIIFSPGTPAEYLLSSFPVSTTLTISVTSPTGVTTSPSTASSNSQFTISNFDYLPSASTDVNGDLTVLIGATITTSGTGTYEDTLYIANISMVISY